ncbi:short-chain dehydrogenase [Saccharobesus litoralis]|uniref:Short-chain dehydrogenase n=1 Tax=Saccharobesus litoralis TaxID=2172099 RepID=A0A2S0VW94_9ALTE|nr:SDR family NAD(P)-dependent oxidoreductase [Saccharobesus litoralis]AWB68494.1 short-chain dehydrogenase [Saccharobesus litoralis]
MTHTDILADSLVIGASSGIAQALIKRLLVARKQVIAVSRCDCPKDLAADNLIWLKTEYDATCIARTTNQIANLVGRVHDVYICHGVLHDNEKMPEKKLEDLEFSYIEQLYHCNTVVPVMWLKQILPILTKQTCTYVTVFSARVGSIGDNQLGGWYGYRASKAALNMMLKTASIELKRRAKGVKLIAFHPGTTNTPLSKPFQKRVEEGKLFTPEFVARQLLAIQQGLVPDGELAYIDWQGEEIAY